MRAIWLGFCNTKELVHILWQMMNSGAADERGGGQASHRGDRLSPERFATLYQEHHRTLWFIAASVQGDRTHAHDVVQEAAMIAIKRLDDFDPSTSFSAWMGQIVRFVALNEGRKSQRARARGGIDEHTPAENQASMSSSFATSPATLMAQTAIDDQVACALASLDEKSRTCLLLRTVRGLSYAQIAATLNMPEGTIMSHVHRAKASLREIIESRQRVEPKSSLHAPLVKPTQTTGRSA